MENNRLEKYLGPPKNVNRESKYTQPIFNFDPLTQTKDTEGLSPDYLQFATKQEYLADKQTFGAELGTQVLKFVPKVATGVINTVADIGDLSNWATTLAGADNSFNKFFGFDANPQNFITQMTAASDEYWDEKLPVYRKDNELFSPSDSAWWVNNIGGLVESVTEFGLTGFGIGKAIGSLGKVARLNNSMKLANAIDATQQGIGAAALTYAEGIQTGVDVYRQGLEKKNGLAPGSLKTSDISSFEPDAELADQAAEAVRWNFLNLGLNYTSLAPAFRANKFSRGLVDDVLKPLANETSEQYAKRLANVKPISVKNTVDEMLGFSKRKALGEVPQEALEEGVNVFAENQGKLAAGLIDESQAGFLNSILSEEGIMAMALGAVGGAGNTAVMNGLVNKLTGNNDKKVAQFNAQKNQILQNVAESGNVIRTVEQLSILQDKLQDAIISKDDNAVEVIKKQIVSSLALNNFENGTTEVFIEQLKSIANAKPEELVAQGFAMNESPEAIAEARAYANQAINIVKENENLYNKIASENRELGSEYTAKLFINRSMYNNTLENLDKANLKKTATINTLNNEVRLNGIESTNGFAGNIDFYNTDNFSPKQLEVIKSLDSYKEAVKAQDSAQDLQNTIQDLNDNYVKQTSKDYKKKLVKEQEEKDFQKQREAKRKRESEVLKEKQAKVKKPKVETKPESVPVDVQGEVEIETPEVEQDFKQMFRDALEDLMTDDTPAEKSIADRVAALERIVLAMGLNPSTFTMQDVFNKYKEAFADTPGYVSDANRFNLLKSIVQAMQSLNQNPNFEDTVLAKLDPETLTLTGLQVKPDLEKRIPTSNPDNVGLADKIREGKGEGQSNYKKIDDELSIAYMDVNYTVTDENGEIVYSDDYVNNQLNFNPSSVLSSSKIVVGDKVVLKVRGGSIDYNTNTDPNKENNYPIDIYVDDVLVGTLHTPEYINKDKIADTRHLELDVMKENISKIRKQILSAPDVEWQSTISDRKFGYFNLLKKGSFTTLAQAFKDDIRTGKVVLGIRQYGKFITNKAVNLYYTNDLAFEDGVGVVLIPHPTGDSKTPIEHVPMFIRTQQLKNEPTGKIYKLVEQAMTEFLNKKITAEQLKTRISPFIYTQIDSGLQNPGNWGVRIQGNSIIINNTRVSTVEDLKQNIGNIFVTLDTGALTGKHPTLKAKEYLEIVSNSNLYQTDVHGREVKINNSVERTYFSQITTVISPDIKPLEATPTLSTKETPQEPVDETVETEEAELDTDLLLEENDLGLPTDDITVEESEEFKLQISELVDLDLQYEAVESFAYMLLTNPDRSLGNNKQWLLNKLKDNLTTFKKYAKFERSPENKAKAEAVVERYNNIIDIYDELYSRAEVFLTELGLKPNTEGYYDTIEETEGTINQMVDNAAFKEDREAGASANIRKFLYFIPDVKDDGTNVRNKLGLYNFNDFKATYNIIAFELAGKYYKSDASGKEKMFRLLSDSSSPILKKVAEKIKTESEQTQREFFMLFNQQHITYNTILFSILGEKTFFDDRIGAYTTYGQNVMANIINSDQVQAQQQIVKQWRGVFNTLPIVKQELNKTSGEVNYVIDTEKGKELYDKLESIVKDKTKFSKGKLTNIDEVYDIVSSVLPISKEAFTDFLNYHLDVMGKRGNHVYLLNNNILRPLFTRISGKSKTASGEDSETSRTNDPFDFESSTVKLLAKYEYLRSKNAHSATLRAGGNQYYSFVRPNPLYRLITQLKGEGGVNQFIADKRSTDVFFNHSYWAENLADVKDTGKDFYENFELLYEKGSEDKKRKYSFKELSQMTAKEFTLTDFWLFQNGGKAQAKIVLDTMSDKTTKPIQGVLRHEVNVNGTIDGGFTLDEKTLDILYRYFLSEYNRILVVQEQNKNLSESQRIQKYHDIGTKQGMGKYFLIYSFLNFDLAEEGSGVMGMYNEDGTIKEGLDKDETIKELVKEQINKNFNQIAQALKQDVESLGLVGERTVGKRTYYSPTPLLDKRYYKKLANRLGYLDKAVTDNQAMSAPQVIERKKQIVDLALVEFLVNKAITSNEMLLLTGDPAQHGKPLRESADKAAWLLDSIKETFNNVSKRNARLLASGNTKYWPDSTYYVGMLVDEKVESPYIDEYIKSLKKLGYSEAEVKKGYENGDGTDAQELTTVEEHLTDMLSSGEINDEEFKIYLGLWDPEAYTKKYKDSPSKPSKEILKKAKNVLQPRKPVQVYGKLDPSLSITKQFYIKTSSFPLIPSVIKGNPIMENLLSQMKSKNVQRVAFQSGVKLGVTSPTKLTVGGKPNPDIFKNNIHELDRDGFAIQLEVPYDEAKEAIREGTQMMKLIFSDMDESDSIDIFGKSMTVGEAKRLYRKLHKDLFDIEFEKLKKELVIEQDINGAYKITDMNKLSEILIEEGLDRGYSVNTLAGLKTVNGNFEVPLNYLSNVSAIEPVLISIVSNRLTKTKLPGKSYVQGSEIYTRDRVTSLEQLDERKKSSIVWTKKEFIGKSKLDFVRGNKNAPTSKAQIIMPFYFIDKQGNQIDTKNFIKDGVIDLSKIDEELLTINGFRIPTQGHNSMIVFEVVGFLPKEHGDLVIVPAEIVAQMGSDFDVDKLYTYHYNYNVEDKITKVSYKEDSKDSAEIKSGIVEINNAVILHPSNFTKLIEPLGSKDFDIIANKLPKADKQWLGAYNPIYQRDEFFDNRGGQIGVGITANSNTQHANAQSSNLYIKDYGVVFSDENGDTYADTVESNRVNEYKEGLYDYIDGEDIVSMVGKLSAWRLDKINTFPSLVNPEGVRISTLISGDLGISVDNAKDKKLALGGVLSKYNLGVKELIHRAGFDNSWALPFINQPILKEYYEILGNLEDSVEMTYGKDKKQKAINELFNKYSTKFNVDNPYVEKGLQPISQIELGVIKTDKGFDINIDTDVNEGNVITQLNVLKHFLYYSDIATELASLTKEFNADVNGLPPTVVEVNKKATSPSKSPSIGNIEEYIENTINGVYYPATEIANELFSDKELFLHNTPAFTQVISSLLGITSTNEFNGEDTNDIFNNIVNYTYSLYQPKDPSLVFDTDTNQSLYTRLLNLKTKYPRNFLLQYLNPISGNEVGEPKRIEMISSIGDKEKFMNKIIMNWSAMLYGTDAELKSFAEDLVKYTLTYAPQQYGQSSLIKYIPFKYFKDSGVTSFIKSIDFNSPDVFSNFHIQFVQHFPEYLPYFDHKLIADKKKTFKQTETKTTIIDSIEIPPITTEFEKNPIRDIIKQDKEGNFFYPPMIRVNNEEIGNIPYILDNSNADFPVYRRIDKLGTKGFFEYTTTQIGSSIIPSNQAPFKMLPEQSQVKSKVSLVDDFFTNPTAESMLLQAKQGLAGDLKGLLANYISMDDTPVNIVLTDQVPYMRTSTDGSTIFINSEFIKEKVNNNTYSMEDIYTSLLHELIHVKTNLKLFSQEFQQTNEYKQLESSYNKYLKSIDSGEANTYKEAYKLSRELNKPFNDLLNNPTQSEIDTLSKILNLPKNDITKYIKSFSADKKAAKSKYYAFVSINEFAALAMTDEGFQSYLKTIPGKSNKSLWKEFVDAILKIFGGNNLLAETVENVIDVVEYGKPTPEPSNSLQAKDYINHSGGAYGGDTFWDIVGREFGVVNHKHYRDAGNTSLSKQLRDRGIKAEVLSKQQMDKARLEVEKLLGKKYSDDLKGNLQVRNYYQVANSDGVFAVAKLNVDNTGVLGGTNTAVQLGIKLRKPVYVWDINTEKWYTYSGAKDLFGTVATGKFTPTETPTLTKNFAGVGSRDIEGYNVQNKETGNWELRKEYVGKIKEDKAKQAIREVYQKTLSTTTQEQEVIEQPINKEIKDEIDSSKKINIYAGTNENKELSNLADRPFRFNFGASYTDFNSVEQAFQAAKREYAEDSTFNSNLEEQILDSTDGFEAKKLGRNFKGLDVKSWDKNSSKIMKKFMLESFKQNPDALQKLLATGNAELTHTQDKGKWGKEFPKLLMEVREELKPKVVDSKQPIDSKYELFSGVEANKGQKEALDKIEEFLKSDKKEFLLQGKGGTGKTTIIKKILETLPTSTILAIAPSHKAKKVLDKSINKGKENKIKTTTVASALAIKLDESTGNFEPDTFARDNNKVPIKFADYIIVDESSMISDELLLEIREWTRKGAKVIFMGDKAQLPPVGQETDSKVFSIKTGYELTEKMRQAKTSPIINIGTLVSNNVETTGDRVNNPITPSERVNKYDNVSNSSLLWMNSEEQALNSFVADFNNDPTNTDNVKIITFNNQLHANPQSVKNLNSKVRKKLFGDKANEQFLPGELVVAYDTYSRDDSSDESSIQLYNSDDFTIKSVEKGVMSNTVRAYSRLKGERTFNFSYDVLYLELLDSDGKAIPYSTVPVIANSSKQKYEEDMKKLWSTDKQLAYKLKAAFANIEYGYAITSHKAQGSTYKNVYVMEDNIMGPSNAGSVKAKNQSLYVAVSRPTTKLVMVSSKNPDSTDDILSDLMSFSNLTKNQQVRLKNLGVSEEEFNSLIFEEQKQLIECYG